MLNLLLSDIEYTGYISPVKFIVFLGIFFLWLWLTGWVYRDAEAVGTKVTFWTAVTLVTGAAAALIWLLIPLFTIGLLFYLIAVGAVSFGYVMHRNTRVPQFQRLLTAEHIKGLFSSKAKKLDTSGNFIFITANNNEIPIPEPKTPDFFGYKSAYDVFTDAIQRRASDIMFSPTPHDYNVTYLVDGAALKQSPRAKDQMEYFIRFIKNLADLDIEERRKPQKGKFRTNQNKENIDWELTTAGSTAGERIELKQLTKQNITRLSEIGLMPDQYEQLNKLHDLDHGLFIIAGPGKSGVTSTFYALLRNHDAFLNSISTLEKKPSTQLPNITQNVFTLSDTGTTTYAKKLQLVVRMGPDVVGVADCQDGETARVACEAAKDGKIVYVTLEADNVLKALGKWMKLVGDKNLVAQSLLGISNQRLLRKLCDECKEAYEPNKELLRKFNIPPEKAKVLYRPGKVLYSKHGKPRTCENCQGTGYFGRTCVFEIIIMNDQLRETIKQSKSLADIGTQFRRSKMLYLQEQALKKVVSGTTAINEMVRIFSSSKKQKQ